MYSSQSSQSGFSLVELLMVVLIIGILSSIVLPTLNGARTKAKNVVAQSTIRNAITAATSYFLFNGDSFGNIGATLQSEEASLRLGDTTDSESTRPGSKADPGAIFAFDSDGNLASENSTGLLICAVSKGDTVYCARQQNQNGNLSPIQRYALKNGSAQASVAAAKDRAKTLTEPNFDNWATPDLAS